MKKRILILMFLLLMPCVFAKQGHISLLAVRETEEGFEGSIADLYLEIVSGSGRVFLETLPLSKLDTQISTRFAKEIACDYIDEDCSKYDFFYTIRSSSAIVGGPSAGSAIALLTMAMLKNIKIGEGTTVTGTINSGGLIGPVGGLKAKINAGADSGIKKIMIPKGERYIEEKNETIDLVEYAQEKGIDLFEVIDLNDVFYLSSGFKIKDEKGDLVIDPDYQEVMKYLAERLCGRAEELQKQVAEIKIKDKDLIDEEYVKEEKNAVNLTAKAENAFEEEDYYSAASYCFGANTNYRWMFLKLNNLTDFEELENEIKMVDSKVDNIEIKTITDLETYMIVKERLLETKDILKEIKKQKEEGEDYLKNLAYAIERAYSADSWRKFFGIKGKEFDFNRDLLRESCLRKISEAEERYQYIKIYFENDLKGIEKELKHSYDYSDNGEYELCLFSASKTKADVDVILSMIGVSKSQVENVLDNRLKVVKENIIEEQEKGIFPILGYSYYEYSISLKQSDTYSSLLYSGYALELSNLDIYFKEEDREFDLFDVRIYWIMGIFACVIIIGFSLALIIILMRNKSKDSVRVIKARK